MAVILALLHLPYGNNEKANYWRKNDVAVKMKGKRESNFGREERVREERGLMEKSSLWFQRPPTIKSRAERLFIAR